VLHVVVGQPDLLQAVVDPVHGEGQPAGGERVQDLLQASRGRSAASPE
jgi:hypothetical protein